MAYPATSIHVLAVAGSLRRDSYNRQLLNAAAQMAPPQMILKVHDTIADIPMFDEDLEATGERGLGGVARLREAIAAADAILIATPEYNQSLPAVLKNTIDWLSRSGAAGPAFAGKPVAITGATVGPWGTRLAQAQLRHALTAVGALTMPTPQLFIADAPRSFDVRQGTLDGSMELRLSNFLLAFEKWIRRLHPAVRTPDQPEAGPR